MPSTARSESFDTVDVARRRSPSEQARRHRQGRAWRCARVRHSGKFPSAHVAPLRAGRQCKPLKLQEIASPRQFAVSFKVACGGKVSQTVTARRPNLDDLADPEVVVALARPPRSVPELHPGERLSATLSALRPTSSRMRRFLTSSSGPSTRCADRLLRHERRTRTAHLNRHTDGRSSDQ